MPLEIHNLEGLYQWNPNQNNRAMVDFEGYDGFKIKSPEMISVFKTVYDFACQGKPVVMFGPSGVGKEFLSRYYFAQYKKATHCNGGFHSLNCAGLSEEFAMSDLFGHMKGAFTSAYRSREGLFKMAQDGVLFLDEVGDLAESVQAMLLRAMDENTREVRRLGGDINYAIRNTTIISATEKSSDSLRDSFRYRLGQPIHVPGLDDRPEDVEEALKFFCIRAINGRLDRVKLLSSLLQRDESEINLKTINDPQIVKLVASHILKGNDFKLLSLPEVKSEESGEEGSNTIQELRTISSEVRQAMKIIPPKEMKSLLEKYEDEVDY